MRTKWPIGLLFFVISIYIYSTLYSSNRFVYAGSDLKRVLISDDDTVFAEIKTALQFVGRPDLQRQGKAAHILLRYEPTYTTFSAADNISIARGDNHLTALIFPNFKNLRQIDLESSDSEHEQVSKPIAEYPDRLVAEVNEAINSAIEEAGLNSFDPPSTSGRGDPFEDIFTDLGDLPGDYSEDMAGENLTQMARKRNAERMAARQKAEAIRFGLVPTASVQPTVVEETTHVVVAETEKDVERLTTEERPISKGRGEKRSVEEKDGSEEEPIDKRPRLEESVVVAPFVIKPKIKKHADLL